MMLPIHPRERPKTLPIIALDVMAANAQAFARCLLIPLGCETHQKSSRSFTCGCKDDVVRIVCYNTTCASKLTYYFTSVSAPDIMSETKSNFLSFLLLPTIFVLKVCPVGFVEQFIIAEP